MSASGNTIPSLVDQACLIVHGPDQPGLVAHITAAITRNEGNITALDQYSSNDQDGVFFQRIVFHRHNLITAMDDIRADLSETLASCNMSWSLSDRSQPKRMAVLASAGDHCLLDLLWRHRREELPVTIPMVISNHTTTADDVRTFGVPFFHVPSQKGPDKAESEAEILKLLKGNVDFVVLARYMQVLSNDFLEKLGVPVINIHHSFLPAFVGADPYRRAWERGVKLIGATAHYVTEDLDEGPIIEQDTVRVTHRDSVADLRQRGAEVERSVLSRAVTWHAEDRVIRNGNHTIVF
ncbi:MAG: formyltetrahydrofolate deformylase [Corynebacterium sp.]|uniref:Formyltetrahydrofolate deformylase n=1 Tax=Candidatus Corynebacterium faecigallinarum TaxID=2838528 RepID=A0A9D2TPQ9_9CORY|nr:formyltetrahydrofolate deformylase [Corynebacterium sp.]HJC86036.1 formyltetrahydrofolate deformylase [Candidatus Corynebacterium faecigallinarum]MDN5722405.1 formyltetrahydrofolate deformylase [Corynebacterium sp.]MDN6281891.1 formyltetrahydrofolate deformylase [Corynebacterium sp.]MDN6305678.1 formyltetrahydrofolate deformylase [Corynebacterium sp.]MDN6368594.1 formyltetrahydrofolate deformylase [Corynebacterium sp.]